MIHSIIDRSPGHATDCAYARKVLATKVMCNRLPHRMTGVRSDMVFKLHHNETIPGGCTYMV